MEVFLDLLSNQPKNDASQDNFRKMLRQRLEERLDDSVERIWDLPPIIVRPRDEYLPLLLEARELYVAGHFYSCVAMCGIVGERLIKDVFRTSIHVQLKDSAKIPTEKAFDQFERVEINGIVRFLKEAEVINTKEAKAAEKLLELRNKYAHARGKTFQSDAKKAIELLHDLVEATVSMFKDFEIKDGVFVPREKIVKSKRDPITKTTS